MNRIFITLEGPDGAGKSTQLRLLGERIADTGALVTLTREPGGTRLSEQVRDILMGWDGPPDAIVDALLFSAARRRHVTEVIRPALDAGTVVVCDRFADSTLAYQGYGSGGDLDALRALAQIATGGLRPSRTVLLDLPVEAGLARRRGGPEAEMTRFETGTAHDLAFHQRVRAGYLEMAAADRDRWRLVDASGDSEAVAAAVWAAVNDLFAD